MADPIPRRTHKGVKATQPFDWFPTACGIRDTGKEGFRGEVAARWKDVDCFTCLTHMKRKPSQAKPVRLCHCCKLPAADRHRNLPPGGRARVRHKCPHGKWCVAGDKTTSPHVNWPRCTECLNARRAEEGLPPVTRKISPEQ